MTNRQKIKSFYMSKQDFDLESSVDNSIFGRSIIEYEIYRNIDVTNLHNVKGYIVTVKQRVIIPNITPYVAGASSIRSYKNYPAILKNGIKIDVNNNAKVELIGIFPRTLNSNVTTSSSSHTGKESSVIRQNSTGSSYTNVNTFGVGSNIGFFGPVPVGGIQLSYSHSWESTDSHQASESRSASMQKDQSYSNSMSIKDWSAYSNLSSDHKSLVWVWGQSYPWDVILYNQAQGGDNIELPNFVKERLLSENLVLPPSELSLLGLDFTAMASWNITFPEGVKEKETITVSHETANYTASHELAGSDISAKLQSTNEAALASYSSGSLDLGLYSLAPIHGYAAENIATIGFMVNPFSYAPTKDTDPFKIVSPMNDLQATGSGFDSVMTTTFKSKPVITICFKIADSSFNYSLVLAHWLEENSGACIINWTVNDTHKGTMSVSNIKNSEGQNNTNRISLRGTDSSSINFHDYLILGLNKIELEIVPSGEGDHQYTLSSAAIQLL